MALSEQVIAETLAATIPGLDVIRVDVSDEINRDGLPVSFLTIRYRSGAIMPGAEQVIGAVRALVERTVDGEGYPVLRMICDDAPALAAE